MTDYSTWTDEQVDRAIAEHVFNRPWRKPTHGPCCTCQRCGGDKDVSCHYCDDADLMLALIDAMGKRGWWCELANYGRDEANWWAKFSHRQGLYHEVAARAATPMRATAEAALKALDGAK